MKKTKYLLAAILLLAVAVLAVGCSDEKTPYDQNNDAGYCVSVKFDANGGQFTSNTSVIVDSYRISDLSPDSAGMVQIPLLAPDDAIRSDDFPAEKAGHFLAGWYAQRTETTDAQGNTVYTYADKWDFAADTLPVDPKGSYSADAPVLTLYAVWAPVFQVEFYDLATGELLQTQKLDYTKGSTISIPQWNRETGALDMYSFPEKDDSTFAGVYYDAAGKQPITAGQILHSGVLDEATGTTTNATMKLYVDYMDGTWYHIYNADQFIANANLGGSYVLEADLDFTDKIWPTTLMYGTFTGTIQGNGHTMANIQAEQTNANRTTAGLFGRLAENAQLQDVAFSNVTFTIGKGAMKAGTTFGLLAGSIADTAQLTGVTLTDSTLAIDSGCYFGTDDYSIGLICGTGTTDLDHSGITCLGVGDQPQNVQITLSGSTVAVKIGEPQPEPPTETQPEATTKE